MTPTELKQWQSDLGLSELAMAAYVGVPMHTWRGWIKGTRTPDAAPMRLIELLRMLQAWAPDRHAEFVARAREAAPVSTPKPRGRPPGSRSLKGPPACQINASAAPQPPVIPGVPGIPSWLSRAL